MLKKLIPFLTVLFVVCGLEVHAQQWHSDILGAGFEARYIDLGKDYSGEVRCTIIRRITDSDTCKRGVLYIHGYNDYFFQIEMADKFVAHGYDFYAVDLRKYGRSILPGQKPFVVRSFNDYTADIDSCLATMQRDGCSEIILMGHSTGGLTAAYYLAQHPDAPVKAVILNSPFLDWNLGWKEKLIPVLSFFGKYFPTIKIDTGGGGAYSESLTKGEHGEWTYNHNWKSTDYGVDLGWIHAVTLAQNYLKKHPYRINIPILLMYSAQSSNEEKWTPVANRSDAVLDVKDIKKYGLLLGKDITAIKVNGGLHDLILSSPKIRTEVYKYLFSWLNKQNI